MFLLLYSYILYFKNFLSKFAKIKLLLYKAKYNKTVIHTSPSQISQIVGFFLFDNYFTVSTHLCKTCMKEFIIGLSIDIFPLKHFVFFYESWLIFFLKVTFNVGLVAESCNAEQKIEFNIKTSFDNVKVELELICECDCGESVSTWFTSFVESFVEIVDEILNLESKGCKPDCLWGHCC